MTESRMVGQIGAELVTVQLWYSRKTELAKQTNVGQGSALHVAQEHLKRWQTAAAAMSGIQELLKIDVHQLASVQAPWMQFPVAACGKCSPENQSWI